MQKRTRVRVRAPAIRLVHVLNKGVIVVPHRTAWTGPWLGATRATSLQRVANRPILCHVLDALREAGVVEAAVVAPADVADEIAACVASEGPAGIAVSHLVHDQCSDESDALLAAAEFVGDAPCIMHRADGLLGEPIESFVELMRDEGSDVSLLVGQGDPPGKRLKLVTERLQSVTDVDAADGTRGVPGACMIAPNILSHLPNPRRSAQLLDFRALAEQLARDGRSVQARVVRKWRYFAGDVHDLLDMNRTMLDALESETSAAATDDNRFEGPISIHPTACVTSSVIIGPVMIGADALISDSYIGPHTSIAERVRIEGAELERSIVLADASVLHVGGRLVASVVGRQARIFRDFSMPRALRLQVGDGDEVSLC
jgi:glucose-1-phosphate thymidylyltransferase